MAYPIVSTDEHIQALYVRLRKRGQSHAIAEMLAFREPPGTKNTDRAFMQGSHVDCNVNGPLRERFLKKARKAGIQTEGRRYISQLADKRGVCTPEAWVSGVGDVRAACIAKGAGAESLGLKAVERDPTPSIPLAEDLVREQMAKEIAKDPGKARKLDDLREAVIEKHGSKRKRT